MVEKVEAYKCPNGGLETDLKRAIAWHIVDAVSENAITFTAALKIIDNRNKIRALLNELDQDLARPAVVEGEKDLFTDA